MKCILSFLLLLSPATFLGAQQSKPSKACGVNQVTAEAKLRHIQPIIAPANKVEADSNYTLVVPVVIHVMHELGPEIFVDYDQALSAIDVMNEDFNRYGNGFNTDPVGGKGNIRFSLATIDPEGNPTTGLDYVYYPNIGNWSFDFSRDSLMKSVSGWDPLRYLNIWTTGIINGGNISGYTYYPEDVAGTVSDGCVVHFWQLGRSGTAVSLGHSTSHEVGHWLGLRHTWGVTEDCSDDDGCEDTPQAAGTLFAEPPFCYASPSCGFYRQVANFMDYSDDACQNMFTQCQVDKMREALIQYHGKMISKENLVSTGCAEALAEVPSGDTLSVFPNPAIDYVLVYYGFDDSVSVSATLCDMTGRVIMPETDLGIGKGMYTIDLSTAAMGVYQLVVKGGTHTLRKSIMIAE